MLSGSLGEHRTGRVSGFVFACLARLRDQQFPLLPCSCWVVTRLERSRRLRSPSSASSSGGSPWQHDGPAEVHAFDVTVPAGTPVDAIIAAVVAIVIIADQAIPLTPDGPVITSITCMFLPLFVSDETLKKSLEPYGQILEITHGVYKDNPSVKTGTRYPKMKMKEDNPPVTVSPLTAEAWFECAGGAKRKDILKHNARRNTAHGASIFGHDGSTCIESCRRCGAGHATVDCTSRQSYASQRGRLQAACARKDMKAGSSDAPMQPPPEKATSAATSASEADQSPKQAASTSRATLEGLGYGPWSTAGEEEDGASTDSEALVIDEEAPEVRKIFLESSSFSSMVSSDSPTDQDMPETSETSKNPAAQDTKRGRPDSGDSSGRAVYRLPIKKPRKVTLGGTKDTGTSSVESPNN
ncbi:hypothetical protein HPB47_018929 [Ixodes persulcatus]|uniref:Uncharacterized protein n=1 Tax=Ixodes persulcatus TaxID=34615 RepID=A0AC60QJH1_IXOPE|nr:hypothetical protein HPB47_018929 [Ixodes persulcatus]